MSISLVIKAEGDKAAASQSARVIVDAHNKALAQAQAAHKRAAQDYAQAMDAAARAAGTATEGSAKKAAETAAKAYKKAGRAYSQSMDSAKKDAKRLGATVRDVGKESEKAAKKAKRAFSDGFVQTLPVIGKMATAPARMAVGWGLVKNAMKAAWDLTIGATIKATNEGIRLRDIMLSAKWFKVPLEQGPKLAGILDDVKTKMDALSFATELKQIGLSEKETQQFAHTINVLAAFTGQGKDAIEKSLKSASITDRQLAVLNKTRIGLQVAMAQAQAAAGGRDLDSSERVQVMIRFLGVTKKTEEALGDLGKASPWSVMGKQLKGLGETILRDINPALLATTNVLVSIGSKSWWAVKKVYAAGKWLAMATAERLGHGGAITDSERKRFKAHEARKVAIRKAAIEKNKQAIEKFTVFIKGELVKRGLMYSDAEKKRIEAAKTAAADRKKNRERLRQQIRKEYLDELISRMKAARAILRNSDRQSLAALSASGVRGIGAVIGGMSKAIELARTFASILGKDFDTRTAKIGSNLAKAQEIFKNTLEAGRGGLQKLITGEKQRTNQLRLSLTSNERLKTDIAIQNQLLNQRKSITQAEVILNKSIEVLSRSRLGVAQKMILALYKVQFALRMEADKQLELLQLKRQIAAIDADHKEAARGLAFRKKQSSEAENLRKLLEQNRRLEGFIVRDLGLQSLFRAKMLDLKIKSMKLDQSTAGSKLLAGVDMKANLEKMIRLKKEIALTEQMSKALKDRAPVIKKNSELAAKELIINRQKAVLTQGKQQSRLDTQVGNVQAQTYGRPQVGPTEGRLESLKQQMGIAKLNAQIAKGRADAANDDGVKAARMSELNHQLRMIQLREEEIKLLEVQADLEQFKASRVGQVAIQMAENASNAISQLFSDIITEPEKALDNLGKNILSAFGDMAFQIGAFFAAEAIGMAFTPGGQAAAVGLAGAAVGMAAIGGLLKGASAAIGAPPPKPPKTKSSKRDKIPGSKDDKDEKAVTINNYYNDVPWRKGGYSPQQNYRDMTNWGNKMKRSTGMGGR